MKNERSSSSLHPPLPILPLLIPTTAMRLELKYTLIMNLFIIATMSVLFIVNDRTVKRENVFSIIEDYGRGALMREIAGEIQRRLGGESNPDILANAIRIMDYSRWELDVVDVNIMNPSGVVVASLTGKALHDQLDMDGFEKVILSRKSRIRYPPKGYYGYGKEDRIWVIEYTIPYIYEITATGDEFLGAVQVMFSSQEIVRQAQEVADQARWLRMEQLLYVGIATIVLTVFINPLTSFLIVRRLERLMETIAAAQSGDLAVRAEDSSRDEIGRLGSGFNRMLERISSEHASRLEALGNLAAGVAHEVRNPLNSIAMTTQYLKETVDSDAGDDAQECLDVITEQVKELDRIVKQFLQLTRPAEMNLETVDLNSFLVDVMRGFASSLEIANVKLKTDFSRELLYAKIDNDTLRQAISNIIINAIQAMPDGGELFVATAWDTPQRTAVIEISDTGVGVPQENIDRLFEPYFTTKPDGTGLGLAITYKIIEAHNGEIIMESEEGQGTTFTILLHNTKETSEIV